MLYSLYPGMRAFSVIIHWNHRPHQASVTHVLRADKEWHEIPDNKNSVIDILDKHLEKTNATPKINAAAAYRINCLAIHAISAGLGHIRDVKNYPTSQSKLGDRVFCTWLIYSKIALCFRARASHYKFFFSMNAHKNKCHTRRCGACFIRMKSNKSNIYGSTSKRPVHPYERTLPYHSLL